jgi:arsenate reductase
VEYLKHPPTKNELASIIKKLGYSSPLQLVRTKEGLYKELDVDSFKEDSQKLLKTMVANPKLIERPILVSGNKAAVGRPPESVLEII